MVSVGAGISYKSERLGEHVGGVDELQQWKALAVVSELALVWCGVPQGVAHKCQPDLGNSLLLPGAAAAAAWGATACSCLVGSHLVFFGLSPCQSHRCCGAISYLLGTQFCSLGAFISPTWIELHILHVRIVLSFMLLVMCCSRGQRVSWFVCPCKPPAFLQ